MSILTTPRAYIKYYKEHTEKAIDEALKQAESLWQFMERYIVAYSHESSGDLIVESIDIWPQLIGRLDVPHRAIFLVDTNPQQWKRITTQPGENDWITAKGLTPEQVKAWALYSAARGSRIIEACRKYDYGFEDVATRGFEATQVVALQKLIQV